MHACASMLVHVYAYSFYDCKYFIALIVLKYVYERELFIVHHYLHSWYDDYRF